MGRDISPLVAAADSFKLNTDGLDADKTLAAALDYIQNK
jgi:cytidylate kinase